MGQITEIPSRIKRGKAHLRFTKVTAECGLIFSEMVKPPVIAEHLVGLAIHHTLYRQACLTCVYVVANAKPTAWELARSRAWRIIDANRTRHADDAPFGRCFGLIGRKR